MILDPPVTDESSQLPSFEQLKRVAGPGFRSASLSRASFPILLLLTGLGVMGCAANPPEAEPLRVAAASDLQEAMPVLVERFRAETGIKVEFTLGSSGQLSQQIEQGAPFDVFLSANRKFVEDLAAQKIIEPDSVRAYALGSLALAVSRSAPATIKTLEDLRRPEVVRVAIANPEVAPYGAAARLALQNAGLWEGLSEKIVMAESVRQVLQFVSSGNAEAGLIGKALAGAADVRAEPIDAELYEPIVQVLGVVAESGKRTEAYRFADFLREAAGRAELERFGFRIPEAAIPDGPDR